VGAKSVVWMVPVENGQNIEEVKSKFSILLQESDFQQRMCLQEKEIIAIKTHFGEENTYGYIKPPIVKILIDKIKAQKARPFLAETSCVYIGKRRDAVDYLGLAWRHGFDCSQVGAPVIIVDGVYGENSASVQVNKKHFKEVQIAAGILQVQGLVSLAHFKGHDLVGFGGTLKNIGMGLANRVGKVQQHMNVRPYVVEERCRFCQKCIKKCPVNAIKEGNKKAVIEQTVCIGCGECVAVCPNLAVIFKWEEGVVALEEKMMECAFGILKHLNKTYFINCAYTITKFCDCMQCENPTIVPDVGILASTDPVALDKATNDLVLERAGKDIWKELHPQCDWKRQLEYAHEIGLGQLKYTIKKITD